MAASSTCRPRSPRGTRKTTRFPPGGLTFVGDLDYSDIRLDLDGDFILDGGSGAALTLSNEETYEWFGEQFAAAIDDGYLPEPNLTGGVTNTFTHDGTDYELPLDLLSGYDDRLKALENTYLDLRDLSKDLQSGAQVIRHADDFGGTFGSEENPVTVYVDRNFIAANETITGYGTLIVADHLLLRNTTLDWHGDVFVKGKGLLGAMVAAGGSTVNVTGNLINLGQSFGITYIGAWGGSEVNVGGNFFIGSDWSSRWARGFLDIAGGSTVSVDGVMTMIGRKTGIDTDGRRDNHLYVNGMLQLAVPDTTRVRMHLDFDGVVEIHRDTELIERAMTALHDLGIEHDIVSSIEDVVADFGLGETKSWKKVTTHVSHVGVVPAGY